MKRKNLRSIRFNLFYEELITDFVKSALRQKKLKAAAKRG